MDVGRGREKDREREGTGMKATKRGVERYALKSIKERFTVGYNPTHFK